MVGGFASTYYGYAVEEQHYKKYTWRHKLEININEHKLKK